MRSVCLEVSYSLLQVVSSAESQSVTCTSPHSCVELGVDTRVSSIDIYLAIEIHLTRNPSFIFTGSPNDHIFDIYNNDALPPSEDLPIHNLLSQFLRILVDQFMVTVAVAVIIRVTILPTHG